MKLRRVQFVSSLLLAAVVGLTPCAAGAQATGQSSSVARVEQYGTSPSCEQVPSQSSATSATCPPTAIPGGVGNSSSASDNAARTLSASATLTQTGGPGSIDGVAEGWSYQMSSLTVTGTPSSGDSLVFHFLFPHSVVSGGGVRDNYNFANWGLEVRDVFSGAYANTGGNYFTDGTSGTYVTNGRQTAGGVDLVLPFIINGGELKYLLNLSTFAQLSNEGSAAPQQTGTALSTSGRAQLLGIDAQTLDGTYISSATFDPTTGLGSISATAVTTTPEPTSAVLLVTGLVGIYGVARRRRKSKA